MGPDAETSGPKQRQYSTFSYDQPATATTARDSSVASRVTFTDHLPSPSHQFDPQQHQHEAARGTEALDSDWTIEYTPEPLPSLSNFRQRLLCGSLASQFMLLLVLLLFSLFVSQRSILIPVALGSTAYLSSDALRNHFISNISDSDTITLILHAITQECLRLPATLVALQISVADSNHNLAQVAAVAFNLAWGVAFTESTLRLWTLWQQTQLYIDVLPNHDGSNAVQQGHKPLLRSLEMDGDVSIFLRSDHPQHQQHQDDFVDAMFAVAIREGERQDLEDALGMPLYVLPSFLLPLWSINS